MKGTPIDYRPKAERLKEVELPLRTCIICQKKTQGYGAWADGFTCQKSCEEIKESKPKLHGGEPCIPS